MLKWIQKDVFQESRISLLIFLDLANSWRREKELKTKI